MNTTNNLKPMTCNSSNALSKDDLSKKTDSLSKTDPLSKTDLSSKTDPSSLWIDPNTIPASKTIILPDYNNCKVDNMKTDDQNGSKINSEVSSENIIKSPNRCHVSSCNKKLGISTKFECKCGAITCSTHKYPNEHSCTIDHKQIGKDLIKKNNPAVVSDKVPGRI